MTQWFSNVCITLNNPTDLEKVSLKAFAEDKCEYAIAAFEIGESGTHHIQAYMQLKRQSKLQTLKNQVSARAHYESAKGSPQDNKDYCSKGTQPKEEWDDEKTAGANYGVDANIFFEYGAMRIKGQRKDLELIAALNHEGASLKDIATDHPDTFIKFHKGILAHRFAIQEPRDSSTPKEVIVHYGGTGTGKTRYCTELEPDAYIYGPEQGMWWDKYDGEKEIIMDEFRAQVTFGYLLRLLDRYPMKVQFKGGMIELVADTIHITAPNHPKNWYAPETTKDGKLDQLKRRITKILYHVEVGTDPIDHTDHPWEDAPQSPWNQFNNF